MNKIIDEFHRLYYNNHRRTYRNTFYRDIPILKCPLDLWVYQELIQKIKPQYIIETGTYDGGSTWYLQDLLNVINPGGRVITIDINPIGWDSGKEWPRHPDVKYIQGSSVDPAIVSSIKRTVFGPVLAIFDSDHSKEHCLKELELYSPIVTNGSYMIMEDTDIHNPVEESAPPGPMEAVQEFLPKHPEFSVDESCEKFYLTFNPGGYLLKHES